MRLDFYDFIRKLFEEKNTSIIVTFYNQGLQAYRDKAWIRLGSEGIEYSHDPRGVGAYHTWYFKRGDWFIDTIKGQKLVGETALHVRLSFRTRGENEY